MDAAIASVAVRQHGAMPRRVERGPTDRTEVAFAQLGGFAESRQKRLPDIRRGRNVHHHYEPGRAGDVVAEDDDGMVEQAQRRADPTPSEMQ